MKEVIVACSGAKHLAKEIAKKRKSTYSYIETKNFPDGEMNLRFIKDVKKKRVILVQSFYGNVDKKILETLFAYHTAKDLGAKKIQLLALYFPYFRKDKRFNKGECISIEAMSKIFKIFNKIYVVDPHLHRIKKIQKILPNGQTINCEDIIAKYLFNLKIKNQILMGPDIESKQWVKRVAESIKQDFVIFKKERYNSRNVKIKIQKNLNIKNKNIIIIDDIISTGYTMIETIKEIKKLKPKKIYCIAIHGIFAEDALSKLQKLATIISTNSIPSKVAKINISDIAYKIK